MTDRDAFRGNGAKEATNPSARSAEKDTKYQRFIERTIKRHPDLKGLKASNEPPKR